jgi:hypothetical protein
VAKNRGSEGERYTSTAGLDFIFPRLVQLLPSVAAEINLLERARIRWRSIREQTASSSVPSSNVKPSACPPACRLSVTKLRVATQGEFVQNPSLRVAVISRRQTAAVAR